MTATGLDVVSPEHLTATRALAAMRAGDLTVEAMARACLARVEARDGLVRAWTHVDVDLVLANARELDRAGPRGRLHGLPIGIKDVILTHDMPTQYNSPIYRGFSPRIDAACVRTLRAEGALIFGKADTVEFAATGRRALTRNPRDTARTPGGSSSGSAAAVADRHVPLALGTQTGGSTIRPASYCGVFAHKPTWNLVSFEGAKVYSPVLDTIGWYARGAADLALLLDVFDPGELPIVARGLEGARIAVCRSPAWERGSAAAHAALAEGARRLSAAGASLVDLDLPRSFDRLVDDASRIMRADGRAAFLAESLAAPDRLDASFVEQVENRDRTTRAMLTDMQDHAALCRTAFDALAAPFDAVLTPSAVDEAPLGLGSTGVAVFNRMWTLLHVPCVNAPGLLGPAGMPIGLTLTGPRFADRRLLALADAVGAAFEGQGS